MSVSDWIAPFSSPPSLALVGGKGANLARLTQAGFAVPAGFIVTTPAYRHFVAANRLDDPIQSQIERLQPLTQADQLDPTNQRPVVVDPAELESVSGEIRAAFSSATMPLAMANTILAAYRALAIRTTPVITPALSLPPSEWLPVAVRSSATAEDLPELSFAGQQDTYLNIVGEEALLRAVVDCWSSLWTARAIGYRLRNAVDPAGIALAVVVQQMVESQSSGVMFTANPLTGLRSETVIDAAFGLGEALVSGRVEPDHYVVDAISGTILEKKMGIKALSIHGLAGGGTAEIDQARPEQPALNDENILALARLGKHVEAEYGFPQDIEWAYSGGELYLLQSRPVTSLFPVPGGLPPGRLMVFFSFAAIQGMLDPITPLGRSALASIFARGAALFGIRVTAETQTVLYEAGERFWINMTSPVRSTIGRRIIPVALPMVEPCIAQALPVIWAEPTLQPDHGGLRPSTILKLARFFLPLAWNVLQNMISPRQRREQIVGQADQLLERMQSRLQGLNGTTHERLAQAVEVYDEMINLHLLPTFLRFVSLVVTGMASLNILRMLTQKLPPEPGMYGWGDAVLELTRGLPYNPTTEMDLDLWRVAREIQQDAALLAAFQSGDGRSLARDFQAGRLPGQGQALISGFLARYGLRGLGEIDLGRPRWNEQPEHIFDVLTGYIQIEQPEQAPDVVFSRGAQAAGQVKQRILTAVRRGPHGWIRVHQARFLAGRMREVMGARESPKFFAVRMMGMLRAPLLEIGAELVRSGDLAQPDDLIYLTLSEMKALAANPAVDWKPQIAKRRAANQREKLRRQVPRMLLSDGRAFYEGIIDPAATGSTLVGSPVSAGIAEGLVRVVLDPRQSGLVPGEILVCPGTDPSWTPLFLSAAGLVMEVGGMMTHGAVVAREYGIPAIVGVDQATHRLQTGQRIRIDGSTGRIDLLEE
jgi:rifampicin phosphotransferase